MKQYSFWDIINNYNVTVPIIQRDYVQGRDNHSAKKKISDFVGTIASHLISGETLSLNFVYGYNSGEAFIPIDGQQRLTTLYLLYLYVFVKAGKEKEATSMKCFNYNVRPSSNRFFVALRDHLDCLKERDFENEAPICNNAGNAQKFEDDTNELIDFLNNCVISKQNWFRKCWLNDLTVRSSVVVLYLLKEKLKDADFNDIYNKLTETNNPIIKFSFLPMNNSQSADETYVKMNARGKQLTPFENFKAELYAFYKAEAEPNSFGDFKKNIDSSWLALALKLIIGKTDISGATEDNLEDIDPTIFALFNVVQTNNMVACNLKGCGTDAFVSDSVFNMRQSDISLMEYLPDEDDIKKDNDAEKKHKECLKESIEKFILLMDYLQKYILSGTDRIDIVKNNICKIWEEDKKDTQHYNERLIIFSLIKFLKDVSDSVPDRDLFFTQWIKMFRHIIDHSEIDKPGKFISALDVVNKLDFSMLNSGSLYNQVNLLLNPFDSPFNSVQIEDEKKKSEYRIQSHDWETAIQSYEDDEYFQGQSIFLSASSGISSAKDYSEYWEKTKEIFKGYGKDNNPLLALFGSKDILIKLDGKKSHSFGFYDDDHHVYDWRGIFENASYVDEYIHILNDFIKSGKTFGDYLNDAVTATKSKAMPDYQNSPKTFLTFVLSQNFKLYKDFQQGRYRFDKGVIKCELLKSKGIAKDDTLDLSIAYIMMKYEFEGYSRSGINYENNEISMCNGTKNFTVSIDASNGHYCLNSTDYADLSGVITAISAL